MRIRLITLCIARTTVGVDEMQFKRSEGFRFDFSSPINAYYKILINGRTENFDQPIYECQIHDVSAHGMKMFSVENFGEHSNKMLQLEIHFILDELAIIAVGNIVWEKPYAKGKLYGLIFNNQPKLEELIISELKARRRKEVLGMKKR